MNIRDDGGFKRSRFTRTSHDLIPKHITKEDIFASINYNMHLEYGIGT